MNTPTLFRTRLLSAMGAIFMAQAAIAAIPYSTDFDAYNLGPIAGQDNWSQSYGDGSFAVIANDAGSAWSGAKYLQLGSDGVGGTRVISSSVKGSIGEYRELTYFLKSSSGTGTSTAFTSQVNYNSGALNFTISYAYNGTVTLFDGTEKVETGFALTPDRWYRVDTTLSNDGKSISFQLTDATDQSIKIDLASLGFTNDATGGTATAYHDLRFVTIKNSGLWRIDSVTTAIPEPSSVALIGAGGFVAYLVFGKRKASVGLKP